MGRGAQADVYRRLARGSTLHQAKQRKNRVAHRAIWPHNAKPCHFCTPRRSSAMRPAHFLQLLLLGAIWGASFLFTRIAVPSLGPAWLIAVRVGCAALFLAAVAMVLRRQLPVPGNVRHFLVLGLCNTAFPFLLFAYAAQTLSASLLSILNSTAPMFGAAIGAVLYRQRPSLRVLAGLMCGSAGVALLVFKDTSASVQGAALPVLAGLVAPFCYGLASHYAKRTAASIEPFAAAHGSMWGATVLALPLLPFAPQSGTVTPGVLAAALALGVLCTGVAYLMYFRLVAEIGATSALTVTFLIPVFGVLWGVVFLDEPFGPGTLVGALVVLAGTALVTGFLPRWLLPAQDGPGH